jgi:hypothetical protein
MGTLPGPTTASEPTHPGARTGAGIPPGDYRSGVDQETSDPANPWSHNHLAAARTVDSEVIKLGASSSGQLTNCFRRSVLTTLLQRG